MAREREHIACANRTQKTIGHLLNDHAVHSPWIATAAFYKALHVVEAVFANDSSVAHTCDHDQREQTLKRARKYAHIYKHYAVLKRASINARYLSECSVFDDYMAPDRVVQTLLKHHLHQVELSAKGQLSHGGASSLDEIMALF